MRARESTHRNMRTRECSRAAAPRNVLHESVAAHEKREERTGVGAAQARCEPASSRVCAARRRSVQSVREAHPRCVVGPLGAARQQAAQFLRGQGDLGAQRRHPPVRGLRTPWRPGRAAVLASSPGSRERDRGASRAGRAPRAARDWRGGGSPARKRLMCATACWPHLLPVLQAHVAGQLVQRWRRARGRASGGVRGERTCAGTQGPLRECAASPAGRTRRNPYLPRRPRAAADTARSRTRVRRPSSAGRLSAKPPAVPPRHLMLHRQRRQPRARRRPPAAAPPTRRRAAQTEASPRKAARQKTWVQRQCQRRSRLCTEIALPWRPARRRGRSARRGVSSCRTSFDTGCAAQALQGALTAGQPLPEACGREPRAPPDVRKAVT